MSTKFLVLGFVLSAIFMQSAEAELVDIGGRRKMYLECAGSGSPTVVFISGRTDRGDIWKQVDESAKHKTSVFDAVAKFASVCVYDRPGTVTISGDEVEASRSTSIEQPITPNEAVADLHALLRNARLKAPFVFVAHSFGGLIARQFASTYPDEVEGLVLVDTLTEYMYDSMPEKLQETWIELNSNYSPDLDKFTVQEKTDFKKSFEHMRKASNIKAIPVVVLTSDQPYDFNSLIAEGILPADAPADLGPQIFQTHLSAQRRLCYVLNAKQVSQTHAGHYIQNEQPQLVVEAIRDVVNKTKGKTFRK